MQDLRVSIFQVDQFWEDKKANYDLYSRLFNEMEDAALVLLPELFNTGFSMNAKKYAEDWRQSEGIDYLKSWATKKNTAIYTSLMIKEEGNYFNRGVFIFPNGDISYYNKRKLFTLSGEDQNYTAGIKECIVSYLGWNINLQICYDLRFPELCRNRMIDNHPAYDLLLYVANWPEKRIEHWTTLLKARAIENQAFVAGANRIGVDGNSLVYSGNSIAFDSTGMEIEFKNLPQEIKSYIFCSNSLVEYRKKFPFLNDK